MKPWEVPSFEQHLNKHARNFHSFDFTHLIDLCFKVESCNHYIFNFHSEEEEKPDLTE